MEIGTLFPIMRFTAYMRDDAYTSKPDDIRLVISDPATILFVNGKKYVSKAHDEPFDEEKGLLMCLAKANGYTTSQIKKLLKNATRLTKKNKKQKGENE